MPPKKIVCQWKTYRKLVEFCPELDFVDPIPVSNPELPGNPHRPGMPPVAVQIQRVNPPMTIFKRDNFPDINYDNADITRVLQEMDPAFALVERIMTHNSLSTPWISALLGNEYIDEENGKTILRVPEEMMNPSDKMKAEARIKERLDILGKRIKFMFVAIDQPPKGNTHAAHYIPHEPSKDPKYFVRRNQDKGVHDTEVMGDDTHRIAINAAYFEYFNQPNANRSPVQDLITIFSLGTTLAHELFHAFYGFNQVFKGDDTYTEPFLNKEDAKMQETSELGSALEAHLWGALTHANIDHKRGAQYIIRQPCPKLPEGKPLFLAGETAWGGQIHPKWMAEMLTEDTWRNLGQPGHPKDVHMPIPRNTWVMGLNEDGTECKHLVPRNVAHSHLLEFGYRLP